MIKQTDEEAAEAFRHQCRRQMQRPLALRMKYGFITLTSRCWTTPPGVQSIRWPSIVTGARPTCPLISVIDALMAQPKQFHPNQAQEIAQAFEETKVEYLFIGKSGAVLLGFPGTTQDVDVFPNRSPENGMRIVQALRKLGFTIGSELEREIVTGKDFVQIKEGPFDVDLVFAPDGMPSFQAARARSLTEGVFKRASGRQKDLVDLPLLEEFRVEYEKQHAPSLRSAVDIANSRIRAGEGS
jgi:hypothetical protein